MLEWISQDIFPNFIRMNENVIAYFYSPQCGACKFQTPVLEQITSIFGNKIHIGQIDVMTNNRLAMEYGITATPTLMFFKKGKKVRFKFKGNRVDRLLGAQDFNRLRGVVNFLINMKII
ncbi:MAG: conjugal transfer protein TraF [Candidatus Helarchaeota archaeon]|nr:conjugal transfer protein TraF [Candidatus Helarchaeota archaeon]